MKMYIFFLLEIVASLLLYKFPTILFAVLLIAFYIGWKKLYLPFTKILFVVALIIGTLGERICVFLGIWKYSYVNFWDLPLWLPLAWGNAAVCIYTISLDIKQRLPK